MFKTYICFSPFPGKYCYVIRSAFPPSGQGKLLLLECIAQSSDRICVLGAPIYCFYYDLFSHLYNIF